MNRATTSTIQGTPLKRLVLILGVMALSSPAVAAGIDSRNYSCPELQRLILSNRFIFINNPNFEDFVVSSVSYCSGGGISGILALRTVPTKDLPECPVNYCLPSRGTTGSN
jgi:hypothetical protein